MKNFMTIFLFSICLGALAANKVDVKTFSIFQGKDNGYYIKKKKEMNGHIPLFEKEGELQMMQIDAQAGNTKIFETFTDSKAPQYLFIVYLYGDSGTSKIVRQYRAAVYNTELFRFEGDLPYKNVLMENGKSKRETILRYEYLPNAIKVYDDKILIQTIPISGR